MASETNDYFIIDEPKPSRWSSLIVSPLAILLAAIFVPLAWTPPFAGRYWIPLLWLAINGWLLGSATKRRELIYLGLGGGLMPVFFFACIYLIDSTHLGQASPYIRILLNGILFFTLYLVVFTQSTSYELYRYIHKED